jgi:hypothetical protein
MALLGDLPLKCVVFLTSAASFKVLAHESLVQEKYSAFKGNCQTKKSGGVNFH